MTQDTSDRFETLQQRLVPLWRSMSSISQDEQTIVVVPSLTLDGADEKGSILQAYEERFLFLLLLLRQPMARLVYVTSQMINPSIIDYYLDLLPGVIPSHARKRLFLLSPLDGSTRPLTQKILARPRFMNQIRALIQDKERAHLVPYITTELERDLALALDIPMYGADPKHFPFGTKSGCRTLFSEEKVPHPLGFENLSSMQDVISTIKKMRAEKPTIARVLVKTNEGAAGGGNARVDLSGVPAPGDPNEDEEIRKRIDAISFEAEDANPQSYWAKIESKGGIVEELLEGKEIRSPSVQLRVTPLGEVELLSTHDQILGGPTGQTYLGCRFPADTAYASTISAHAMAVGKRLAKEGVLGRFALDFVVTKRDDESWDANAIEINLRKGGTTHPFLTLQFLTDGTYNPASSEFVAPSGRQKFFVATDHLENPDFTGFVPDDLFDIVVRRGLHFDQSRQTGVVFHMMSALSEHGVVGMTAVGESHDEAEEIYNTAENVLAEEARA